MSQSDSDDAERADEMVSWLWEHDILQRTAKVGGVQHFGLTDFGHELAHVLWEIHERIQNTPALPCKGRG